jgi:hypothetical protein
MQGTTTTPGTQTSHSIKRNGSATDNWMDSMIQQNKPKGTAANHPSQETNPYEELDRFFAKLVVDHEHCPDIIAWWGVSKSHLPFVQTTTAYTHHYGSFNTLSTQFYD